MLANLEHLDFSFLQLQFFQWHVLLLDDLDGDFLLSLLVNSALDNTELAFAQIFLDRVEVINTGITNGLFDLLHPLASVVTGQ